MASLAIVVSAVVVLSFAHTHTHKDTDERYTPATLVGVNNDLACYMIVDVVVPYVRP